MEQVKFFSNYLAERYGRRMYRIALDLALGCPNRPGGFGPGCVYCAEDGNRARHLARNLDLPGQIASGISFVSARYQAEPPYIAYFQSFTNTYAPLPYLSDLFSRTLDHPQIAALSIGTRPDCLEDEKIRLLAELNRKKPVWVELGLQTIHPNTAALIRRGYPLSSFADTAARLKEAGLTVIVHLILGLPGESREQMLSSVDYTAHFLPALDGIKLQLLHVLKGTDLAAMYEKDPFPLFSMEEYADFIVTCIEHLPPSMTVHRITGDGPRSLLIAPEWSLHKRQVLNTIDRRFRERNTFQGAKF